MAGNVQIGLVRVAADTAGLTTQDFTVDMGGKTPKLMEIEITSAVTDGVAADTALYCVGCADGTNQFGIGISDRHGTASSTTFRIHSDSSFIQIPSLTSDAVDGVAAFTQFLSTTDTGDNTTGGRITWSNNPTNAVLITVRFYAGDDLQVAVGSVTMSTQNTDVTTTAPGFELDVGKFFCHGGSKNTSTQFGNLSIGYLQNAVTDVQRAYSYKARDGRTSTDAGSMINTDCVGGQLDGTDAALGMLWKADVHTISSTGFTVAARDGSGATDELNYMLLKVDTLAVKVGSIDAPTATGSHAVSLLSFKPQYVEQVLSMHTAEDTGTEAAAGCAYAVSSATTNGGQGNTQFCNANATESAAATVNSQSVSDNVPVNLDTDAGAAAFDATFTSFDATGWTYNYSAADATPRKGLYFAIEEQPAAGSLTPTTGGCQFIGNTPAVQIALTPLAAIRASLSGNSPQIGVINNIQPNSGNIRFVAPFPPVTSQPNAGLLRFIGNQPVVALSAGGFWQAVQPLSSAWSGVGTNPDTWAALTGSSASWSGASASSDEWSALPGISTSWN